MKLATFTYQGVTRIGIVNGETIVDLTMAAPELPREMVAFLEAGVEALERARKASSNAGGIPLSQVKLEAPIADNLHPIANPAVATGESRQGCAFG